MSALKKALTALVAVALLSAGSMFVAPEADAHHDTGLRRSTSLEAQFVASLNAQRTARGLAPLRTFAPMTNSAANWTARMVSGGFLAHSRTIAQGVPSGWTLAGENVGRGRTVASLTRAFMNSPTHRANVLNPRFQYVGVAVYVHPSGKIYTTHRFAAVGR